MAQANYKERLAIIEPLIMKEGYTLKKISENTDLTLSEIKDTIYVLNRVGTEIYNEEKYTILKQKMKENANIPFRKEKIEEKDYRKYLDQIEYYVMSEKRSVIDIPNKFSISMRYFYIILNFLNNPNSMYYNPKRYEKIKNQIQQNLMEKRTILKSQSSKINIPFEELHSKIDDSKILALKGKKATDLSQEEKDLIARYQLKYYLSSSLRGELLGYDKNTIQRYSASLAEKNMIFAEKYTLHTKIYKEQNERYAEQYNANFSRGEGVLDNWLVIWRYQYE